MPTEKDGEWRLRRRVRRSLAGWARFALAPQGQAPARHHRLLLQELAAVSAGRVDRLLLLLPPGHAKSTYASLVFPPWFLARHPRAQVLAVSHTQALARHFGLGYADLSRRTARGSGSRSTRRAGRRSGSDWRPAEVTSRSACVGRSRGGGRICCSWMIR